MLCAAAQISSGPNPEANLHLVEKWCQSAAQSGVRLLAFPEATMRAFGAGSLLEVAESSDGPWCNRVREMAREYGLVVTVGFFQPSSDGLVLNSTLVTDGRDIDAVYDKIHLYDAFGFSESHSVAAGNSLVTFDVDGVRVGLATCYDLRFPGLFTALAQDGVSIIVCGASWAAGPGKVEQWQLLTRARALDSTSVLIACGQYSDPEPAAGETVPTGVGHSCIIAADGAVIAAAGTGAQLLQADIDPAEVFAVRAAIPVLSNGRITEIKVPT